MTEPKSLEQEADEALAEAEASNGEFILTRLKDLEEKVEAWDEIVLSQTDKDLDLAKSVHTALKAVRDVKSLVSDLHSKLKSHRKRLDRLDPSFNQNNCSKCSRKLAAKGGKCGVCSHQN